MNTYVTVADVDEIMGSGWATPGDPDSAVFEANAWMTDYGVRETDPVEDDVKQAGARLAKMASQGDLYSDQGPVLKSKRIKASSVETQKEYRGYSGVSSGDMRLIQALLRPYTGGAGGGSNFAVRRA